MAKKELVSFPKAIEFQTASFCNGGCSICPYKEVSTKLPAGVIEEDIFKRLVDEISEHEEVRIIPYFNNEPFLDKKFVDRLRYIRSVCPKHVIEISTNISMLTSNVLDKMDGLYIDDLRISFFSFNEKSYENIMTGLNWDVSKTNLDNLVKNNRYKRIFGKISIVNVDIEELKKEDIDLAKKYCEEKGLSYEFWGFFDRAGNVKNRTNNVHKEVVRGCEQNRPIERMHIIFDGKVILCCMDWKREYILGDLKMDSIKEIWNSQEYSKIRDEIYDPQISPPDLCKKCKLAI